MSALKARLAILGLTICASAGAAQAAGDPCAIFFWTNARKAAVARYQPRYVIGEGLEDVGMSDIAGLRIRYRWSQQAASCLASSNSYGYFANPAFNQIACAPGEACFPGSRQNRMSERVADIDGVVSQLVIPNPDPTYQANLYAAKTNTFFLIDAIANAVNTTTGFLTGLVADYDSIISSLDSVLNLALPVQVRTFLLDQMCSPDNVSQLEALHDECFFNDNYCDLSGVFDALNDCTNYHDGAVIDQMTAELTATRAGLVSERAAFTAERDGIAAHWAHLQQMR